MRQPEMTHSPAYYRENPQMVPTSLHDSSPAAPQAAHIPRSSTSSQHQDRRRPPQGAVTSRPSSKDDPPTNTAYPSDPWDPATYSRHSYQHSQSLPYNPHHSQALGEPIYPDSEPPAVAPATFVSSSSHGRDGRASVLPPASQSGSAARKEDRARGSWTDHSSYMSGDNHHAHGASRVQKRPVHDEEPFADDSQDALMMLFRLSLPIPIFSFCASLYTVFGLLFVLLISPFRLCSCIPYLRKTSFRAQLCDLLVPQLHCHERLIRLRRSSHRSSSTQSIYNDPNRTGDWDPTQDYSIGGLVVVLLLSSFLTLAFFLLAWTAAFFWIFAMILGNPDGTERRDDGRAAVLGVCKWWQIWLGKARKSPR